MEAQGEVELPRAAPEGVKSTRKGIHFAKLFSVAKKYYEKRDPDTYVETTTAEEVDFWSEEKEDGSDEWSNFFDD